MTMSAAAGPGGSDTRQPKGPPPGVFDGRGPGSPHDHSPEATRGGTPPPPPEWVREDGTVDQSRMPQRIGIVDAQGNAVVGADGRPVTVELPSASANTHRPTPEELEAQKAQHEGFLGPDGTTVVRVEPKLFVDQHHEQARGN